MLSSLQRAARSGRGDVRRLASLLNPRGSLESQFGIARHPERVIVFRELGEKGQLGNQLWQIASTLGMAASQGADARFPEWPYRDKFSVPNRYFQDAPLDGQDAWALAEHIPPEFQHCLQDFGLWKRIAPLVRRYFAPSPTCRAEMESKFSDILALQGKIAMHVRRGDYLKWPTRFPVATEAYYRDALTRLPKGNVLVFSDDIPWCRENLSWADPVLYVDGNRDYEDLFLISRCERHVMANSSFSWWGAFLSVDRHPIYPVRWYGSTLHGLRIDPTLMWIKGWIGIDA
jgi:hypothetical protein